MKAIRLLLVAVAALVWTAPASASYFYYHRTSLTNSTFEALDNYGDWTGYIRAGSGSGTDACQHNNWIPLGYYGVLWHDDNYAGSSPGTRLAAVRLPVLERRPPHRAVRPLGGNLGPGTELRTGGQRLSLLLGGRHDYYSLRVHQARATARPSDLRQVDSFVHTYGMATDLWVFS